MSIDTVVNTYFILLLVGGIISFLLGVGLTKKLQSVAKGYFVLFGLSLLILVALIWWFRPASAALYIGTIPWLLDQAVAIIIYPFYLLITWFLLKMITKRWLLNDA